MCDRVRVHERHPERPLCKALKDGDPQEDDDARTKRCLLRKVSCMEGRKVRREVVCAAGSRALTVGPPNLSCPDDSVTGPRC